MPIPDLIESIKSNFEVLALRKVEEKIDGAELTDKLIKSFYSRYGLEKTQKKIRPILLQFSAELICGLFGGDKLGLVRWVDAWREKIRAELVEGKE